MVCRRTSPSKGEADARVGVGVAWAERIPLVEIKKYFESSSGFITKILFRVCGLLPLMIEHTKLFGNKYVESFFRFNKHVNFMFFMSDPRF